MAWLVPGWWTDPRAQFVRTYDPTGPSDGLNLGPPLKVLAARTDITGLVNMTRPILICLAGMQPTEQPPNLVGIAPPPRLLSRDKVVSEASDRTRCRQDRRTAGPAGPAWILHGAACLLRYGSMNWEMGGSDGLTRDSKREVEVSLRTV